MKKLLVILFSVTALVFSACSMSEINDALENGIISSGAGEAADDEYAYEDTANKLLADTTLYNSYLGISYTIPSGWWLYDVNNDNFDENSVATGTAAILDIYFGEDYTYLDLAYFGNLQYSSRDNHVGIDLSAEAVEGADTLEAYMVEYIEYTLAPYDGAPYTLLEESKTELQGRAFHQCIFEVGQEGSPYNILTMTCEVNDGYFLTLAANYWPENKKAVDSILQFMDDGLSFL